MNKTLSSLYGLKWNPFSPEIPTEACRLASRVDDFGWRVENLAREGGFALVLGEVGTGKSVVLRQVRSRLAGIRELTVGVLTRPQGSVPDFYRELGDVFGVRLSPHNRWAGAKVLRERWQSHIESALHRAVLLVDEAQEMRSAVLEELRLLASADLDSRSLLTVVLSGDGRLSEKFKAEELVALGSRIRVRLQMEALSAGELSEVLRHAMAGAGNVSLMTSELVDTLAEHALGNLRVLMTMAGELLDVAVQRKVERLDEKLYLERFAPSPTAGAARVKTASRGKTR
jgi:type II secretory pathway predicted ATPase ExeA